MTSESQFRVGAEKLRPRGLVPGLQRAQDRPMAPGAPPRTWSAASLSAWHASARQSDLYAAIEQTQEARPWARDRDLTPIQKAAEKLRTAGEIGPWGAAYSMEVVLAAFGDAVHEDEGPVLVLGGFRGIEDDGKRHGNARTLLQQHADRKWREHNLTHGRQGRTAFVAKELNTTSSMGRASACSRRTSTRRGGTIDYAACRIDDAFLWPILCLAEAEMSTAQEEAVRDFNKLLVRDVTHRLFICRASWEGDKAGALRRVLDEIVAASPVLRATDELAVLMLVTGRGAQRPPWGGVYETMLEAPHRRIVWQELGG